MTSRERGTARRYAQALFELALERGQAEDVRGALRTSMAALTAHPELRGVLLNAAVAGERKRGIVKALWPVSTDGAGLVARLVELLAERHRIASLGAVEEEFSARWNAHRQVLSAEVVTAVPLDDSQLEGLRRAVHTATGRNVEFKTAVDARLLGGVRLTMDGRVYDGSVRVQLAALRARLAAAGGPA